MLLYIHVPFCRSKCAYCSFYSLRLPRGRLGGYMTKRYLSALIGEMRARAASVEASGLGARPPEEPRGIASGEKIVSTVFFGGGTPSILPGKAIAGILEEARKCFALAADAEITLEANPESLLQGDCASAARKAGINRLSIGVQSFDDATLSLLGRAHDARQAEAAFAAARRAGFSNINLDLIWGLPGRDGRPQSQMQWLATLRKAVNLQPEHISTYGLALEEGLSLTRRVEEGELVLPGERELASMYLAGADFLEGQGYMQYEISNFARMGFPCRHNSGYWRGEDYLGLGPAAASTLGARRRTNPADLKTWADMAGKDESGAFREELDALTGLKEVLMLRLRTCAGLSFREWQMKAGRSFLSDFGAQAALLQQKGLARTRAGNFYLTRTGMLVSDTILARFFAELERVFAESGRLNPRPAPCADRLPPDGRKPGALSFP
ncbi:MAG: radical SAM family heme chaperone HemW [Desulfovibrio sp.]|jgi:oxygen-independent coproporphyrinogen-3 oxidase|nr:radical SAM family heme chaperone HemW [Desulfovibrio sp.]